MNRTETLVILKSAAANIVRGGAAALVAFVLPPFLARMMPPPSYGAWLLILQLAGLVAYLDFGIQTAVGRYVAYANEASDPEHRDQIVSTSFLALAAAGALALVASIVVAVFLPNIFRQMPGALIGDSRIALLLVASSLAIGLPASVFNGVFVGLQRYEVPAATIGGSRIVSALLIVLVVKQRGGLAAMGAVVAAANLASYALQYWMYKRVTGTYRISRSMVSLHASRELFHYCLGLSVWSFGMLLVSGLDISLVGYFQFSAVVYYAVAASLTTILTGLHSALFTVMIPSSAVLHARSQPRELAQVVVSATRYSMFILLITGLPLFGASRLFLRLWVGPSYADHGALILQLLVGANVIRLSGVPYSMVLIGTGQQRLVMFTPILEGVCNLVVSLWAGYLFGAMGVAIGTLFGSIVSIAGHVFYNMPRTTGIALRVSDYLRDGLLRPGVCALPAIACYLVLHSFSPLDVLPRYLCLAAAIAATGLLIWRWGLVGSERASLRAWRLVLPIRL